MNAGKEKCELLRHIRRDVAERYGLEYNPTECTHEGDCSGTCPACDAELRDLERQLRARGIDDVVLSDVPIPETIDNDGELLKGKIAALEGDVAAPDSSYLMGIPGPPLTFHRSERVLYKECKIAGIAYHDLEDTWDELYEGARLVLVRDKDNEHDKYAVAVAFADDYDGEPEDFDFDYILGYLPRTENKHIATLLDLGWSDVFECELSKIYGDNPQNGSLYMNIYMVSKDEEAKDTRNLLRVLELNEEEHKTFMSDLKTKGCTYFRCGGFPPWERNYPNKGEQVVFMHRDETTAELYLMHCIAVGDDDAAYFVKEKDMLHAVDDCCFYVFTNVKGPVMYPLGEIDFLDSEEINTDLSPEAFLSEDASIRLKALFLK